jgi:hypothetical protein
VSRPDAWKWPVIGPAESVGRPELYVFTKASSANSSASLAYVVRVGERGARRDHAGRVKSGRAVHFCRRSACLSRRCVGLCIVVVAVLAAATDTVLVAPQVHPATLAGNPKA